MTVGAGTIRKSAGSALLPCTLTSIVRRAPKDLIVVQNENKGEKHWWLGNSSGVCNNAPPRPAFELAFQLAHIREELKVCRVKKDDTVETSESPEKG